MNIKHAPSVGLKGGHGKFGFCCLTKNSVCGHLELMSVPTDSNGDKLTQWTNFQNVHRNLSNHFCNLNTAISVLCCYCRSFEAINFYSYCTLTGVVAVKGDQRLILLDLSLPQGKPFHIKNTEGQYGKSLQLHKIVHLYKYKHTCIYRMTVFNENIQDYVTLLLRLRNRRFSVVCRS